MSVQSVSLFGVMCRRGQEGDPRNFYDGRSISHLLRNNLLRVLKSATRETVVVVKFPVVYPS